MFTLLAFAFLSGIITVLSPCILPILPLLLSAGIGEGRYRPYGIITGIIISFTFFTLSLTALVQATGISPEILRYIALALIIFFGLTLLFPQLELLFNRMTAPFTRLGDKLQGVGQTGHGFFSGFIVGIALGLIWTPCAGPILATVITLVAAGSITWNTIMITLAYSCGTALPMFFIMYGGSKITDSISAITPYTQIIRRTFGALMIVGALAIALHFDVVLQQLAVQYFPVIKIENNELVKNELALLQEKASMNIFSPAPSIGSAAPDFVGISDWLNTQPLTMEQLKGKVVLVDFWTYSCINCVRTLPYTKKWYTTYQDKGFVLVGVHTPEFAFEKSKANVADAIKRFDITYPVALDNDYATWNNYHNNSWPAHYLIDQQGIIRDIHFGEGKYEETENLIRSLLGLAPLSVTAERAAFAEQTPELYLGFKRAEHYIAAMHITPNAATAYDYTTLKEDEIGLKNSWLIAAESITAQSNPSILSLNFIARHVYLVMSAPKPSVVKVLLDNDPVPTECYTRDMNKEGTIMVQEPRMYEILNLGTSAGRHIVTLEVPENVSLYAFTFG